MAKVAREMVERSGVNVERLLELLVANAAAELVASLSPSKSLTPRH